MLIMTWTWGINGVGTFIWRLYAKVFFKSLLRETSKLFEVLDTSTNTKTKQVVYGKPQINKITIQKTEKKEEEKRDKLKIDDKNLEKQEQNKK